MEKQLIVGLGTGRCGTFTLAQLLNDQLDTHAWHELRPILPWDGSGDINLILNQMLARPERRVANISLNLPHYVPPLLDRFPTLKVIVMCRNAGATAASYVRWLGTHGGGNRWSATQSKRDEWYAAYPHLEDADEIGVYACAARFCDEFYDAMNWLYTRYFPRVHCVQMDALNNEAGVRDVLDFVGIPRDQQVVTFRKLNTVEQPHWTYRAAQTSPPEKRADLGYRITLATSVLEDCELLPWFLSYYLRIGVDAAIVNVDVTRGESVVPKVREIVGRFPGFAQVGRLYTAENSAHGVLANDVTMLNDLPAGDWKLPADVDELVDFGGSIRDFIAKLDAQGADHALGRFVDRVAADGSLPPPSGDLRHTYPVAISNLTRLGGGPDTKCCIYKGKAKLDPGKHAVHGLLQKKWTGPWLAVHHFKWREAYKVTAGQRRQGSVNFGASYRDEVKRLQAIVDGEFTDARLEKRDARNEPSIPLTSPAELVPV